MTGFSLEKAKGGQKQHQYDSSQAQSYTAPR